MEYKASVIMPVYNAEKTLRRCVESLLFGKERDVQIILSEDRSKDGSWDVCCRLAEEYPQIKALRNEKNMGVSHTRNCALDAAQGEYILFVDSDDWVSETYAKTLLSLARQYPDALPACGLHFLDYVHNTQRNYVWDEDAGQIKQIDISRIFELADKFMLQQSVCKIFRRDLIEKYHIRFPVNQSMGEDTQFVLDYLEKTGIRQFAVLNEPLYYYIRWNTHSLMSKFGLTENENALKRLNQMLRLSGGGEQAQKARQQAEINMRQNSVYQAVHAKNIGKKEKLAFIARQVGSENASDAYCRQHAVMLKEQAAHLYGECRRLPVRVRDRLRREKNKLIIRNAKKQLKNKSVSVISQNCIAGVFYHDMGMQFLSPTVNLYFTGADFVRFAGNLEHYLSLEPVMSWLETYPVGQLEDVTVHFMHYESCTQAKDAWMRRKERVNLNNIMLVATDMEGFDEETFKKWTKLPYKKVLFTANPAYAAHSDTVYMEKYQQHGCVQDLISHREFYTKHAILKV